MKLLVVLGSLTLGFLLTAACTGSKDRPLATQPSPVITASTAPTGGGSGGPTFSTASQLAHHYNQDIIVPIGVPLGSAQTEVSRDGGLEKYGYWILGGMGDLWVFGAAPPEVAALDNVVYHNADFVEVRRSMVIVRGGNALLIQERHAKYLNHDSFRLLWSESGRVVQVEAASAGQQGQFPTVGPDALIAIANATRMVTLSEVDTAGILLEDRGAGPLSGQVSSVASVSDARRLRGGSVIAPAVFSFIHVLHAGVIRSYTVDLDAQGTRRLFLSPESPANAVMNNPGALRILLNGTDAAYDVLVAGGGKTSLLFFSVRGQNLLLRDANGASAPDLVLAATGVASCCSLQLDMDPATLGVQAVRSVSGPQDISIDIVLGDSVGNLGAFNFGLVYDDTRLTPGAAGGGGLAGNPDFNESALGGTWNCGLGGSPLVDTDPATGPGHGAALLSCFTTASGSDIAAATVIATLRLHVAASGASSITIGDAHFAHNDTTDIGTCDAASGGTMTCAGGSVTAP